MKRQIVIRVTSLRTTTHDCLDSLFVRIWFYSRIGKERFAHQTADSIASCWNDRNMGLADLLPVDAFKPLPNTITPMV